MRLIAASTRDYAIATMDTDGIITSWNDGAERLFRQEVEMACVDVTDTGKGIPSEFLPHVFDMFRQANNGTTRQYGGMGIGLALVKELVHSHGGWVEAESRGEGHGSRLRFCLPVTVPKALKVESENPSASKLAGKRILLVDDANETLEALAVLLTHEGALVTTASSTATTPAIALSGFTRPNDVTRALSAGFETHIRKPVVFDQFIATAVRISS